MVIILNFIVITKQGPTIHSFGRVNVHYYSVVNEDNL